MSPNYQPPVSRLLELGELPARKNPWPNYLDLDLSEAHIDELIRMALDPALNDAMSDSDEVWAALHAWRALGQLRAEKAAGPLTQLLVRIDENDDDWVMDELPIVFGMIGPPAITVLQEYLATPDNPIWARVAATEGLKKIAQQHPHTRDECVRILIQQLSHFAEQDETLNSFIIIQLMDLKAVKALDVIKQAFEADRVDLSVHGDLENVLNEMGVPVSRPQPIYKPPKQPRQKKQPRKKSKKR